MRVRGKSLYSEERVCWLCGSPYVECHHVLGGVGRRPISDREGCWVYLCHEHHQGLSGVHYNADFRNWLRADCQRRWMEANDATVEDFIAVFGENYL